MSKEQEQLLQWIDESDNIVFFGGAGVSTESKTDYEICPQCSH